MGVNAEIVWEVEQVLAGTLSYDEAGPKAQRYVRDAWRRRIADRMTRLDLEAELHGHGPTWAECDPSGRVVVVER